MLPCTREPEAAHPTRKHSSECHSPYHRPHQSNNQQSPRTRILMPKPNTKIRHKKGQRRIHRTRTQLRSILRSSDALVAVGYSPRPRLAERSPFRFPTIPSGVPSRKVKNFRSPKMLYGKCGLTFPSVAIESRCTSTHRAKTSWGVGFRWHLLAWACYFRFDGSRRRSFVRDYTGNPNHAHSK